MQFVASLPYIRIGHNLLVAHIFRIGGWYVSILQWGSQIHRAFSMWTFSIFCFYKIFYSYSRFFHSPLCFCISHSAWSGHRSFPRSRQTLPNPPITSSCGFFLCWMTCLGYSGLTQYQKKNLAGLRTGHARGTYWKSRQIYCRLHHQVELSIAGLRAGGTAYNPVSQNNRRRVPATDNNTMFHYVSWRSL